MVSNQAADEPAIRSEKRRMRSMILAARRAMPVAERTAADVALVAGAVSLAQGMRDRHRVRADAG